MAIKNEIFKKGVGLSFRGKLASFRVWAPNAASVGLVGDFNAWQETPLASEGDGYWSAKVADVAPGATYQYVIHTGSGERLLRNDPRAMQMTESADGISVVPDMDFDWGGDSYAPPPKNKMVTYEMHIGTFNRVDKATTGTFHDAIEKLDHVKSLGVTTIELMPITSMDKGFGWGYSPNSIYAVESLYGGRQGLLEFVKQCHRCGLGVILDVVYNHLDGKYLWQFDGWSDNNSGGIYFYGGDRAETRWGGLRPDYGRSEVRQFILDNIKMWLVDYHIDGFRLDSTISMRNKNGLNNDPAGDIGDGWSLMGSITELAHEINPQALVIAEDFGGNEYLTKLVCDGGCGFDAQWDLSLPHCLRRALGESDYGDVAEPGSPRALGDVCYSLFLAFNGDAMQKVIFADSHDSAGNGSDRITDRDGKAEVDDNSAAAQKASILASAVALTAPGIPMLLQGQEFMQGGDFNSWRELDWGKAERFAGVVDANKHLLALRLNTYGDTGGLTSNQISIFHRNDQNRVLGYRRTDEQDNEILVIVNFTNTYIADYRVVLPFGGAWRARFNSSWPGYVKESRETKIDVLQTDEGGAVSINLRGYMVLILSR